MKIRANFPGYLVYLIIVCLISSCDSKLPQLKRYRPIQGVQLYQEEQWIAIKDTQFPASSPLPRHRRPTTARNVQSVPDNRNQPNISRVASFLKQVGSQAVTFTFAMLVWRQITTYDMMIDKPRAISGFLIKSSAVILGILNLLAVVLQFFRPLIFKPILKSILVLNLFREVIAGFFNLFYLLTSPSSVSGTYLGQLVGNIWWSISLFSYSRSRWVMQPRPKDRQPEENWR